MQSQKELLEKLIESNIKTQESVAEIVKAIKELTAALRAAAELPEEETSIKKTAEVEKTQDLKESEDINKQLSAKLDKMLEQNALLLKALNELATNLKIKRL
ncbi:MAG: hypothetical protein QXQ79_00880 [Candidatus Nanoarchaeia archaeon]